MIVWIIGTMLGVASANARADDAAAEAAKKLEGEWRFVAIESEGKQLPLDSHKDRRMIFKGQEITVTPGAVGRRERKMTFKLE